MKRKLIILLVTLLLINTMAPVAVFEAQEELPNLEAPQKVMVEVKQYEDERPYFEVSGTNSASVLELVRYWDNHGESPLEYHKYGALLSTASISVDSYYKDASNWAKPELQEAYDNGFIPDILMGADMTRPINREEFAELMLVLCEKTTGKPVTPYAPNPFTDTTNPQVLKAYALGITLGTSNTTFSPDMLINREQCATMLYRTIKIMAPDIEHSISGVKDFPDQEHISGWAVEGAKYLSKLEVIKGDNNGNFMPKAVTSSQESAGYGMATREAAILMTVRTWKKLSDLPSAGTSQSVTQPPSSSTGIGDVASIFTKIKGPDTLYYEYERFYGTGNTVGKLWRKNGKIRDEFTVMGKTSIVFNNTNTKRGYLYYPADNLAYDMDFSPEHTYYLYDLHGYYSSIDTGKVRITGTETYNGLACTVLSIVDKNGNEEEKFWVSEKYGFPVKTETKEFEELMKGLVVVMECSNIKTEDIPDSVFDLPQGVRIEQPISVE